MPTSQQSALWDANVLGTDRVLAEGFLSTYDETKFRAHEVAEQRIAAGAQVLIAQAGAVYGPGDTSEVGNIIDQARTGRLRLFLFPEFVVSYVYVDDLARGLLAVLDRGTIAESCILGGEMADLRTLVTTVAELAGRNPPRGTMPTR